MMRRAIFLSAVLMIGVDPLDVVANYVLKGKLGYGENGDGWRDIYG